VTVWRNCLIYFTDTHERYRAAKKLSRAFDDAYHARISAPRHRECMTCMCVCVCVCYVLFEVFNDAYHARISAPRHRERINCMLVCVCVYVCVLCVFRSLGRPVSCCERGELLCYTPFTVLDVVYHALGRGECLTCMYVCVYVYVWCVCVCVCYVMFEALDAAYHARISAPRHRECMTCMYLCVYVCVVCVCVCVCVVV
jgi:hypothetical protein